MSVLVLGGAGYIGSHTVDRLVDQGQDVVVVDSLVTGHRAAVNDKAKFYQGDLADQDFMRKVFTENPEIDAVIHFAAYSLVAESMKKPLKYFDNNTAGMIKLLEVMNEFDIKISSFHQRQQLMVFLKRCRSWKVIPKIRSTLMVKVS